MVDGITPAVVFPIFNFFLRTVQTAYEVASVPAETSDYLKTISQVVADIKTAKTLLAAKLACLKDIDAARVEDVIQNIEEAVGGVEVLVEPARVDMSVKFGNVGVKNRVMWVIRDSNKVNAAMSRLAIASQSLHREITLLQQIQDHQTHGHHHGDDDKDAKHNGDDPWGGFGPGRWQPAPPTYLQATADSWHKRQSWQERRNSVAKRRTASTAGTPVLQPAQNPQLNVFQNDLDFQLPPGAQLERFISENETILSSMAPPTRATVDNLPVTVAEPPSSFFELEGSTVEMEQTRPRSQPRPMSLSSPLPPPNAWDTAQSRRRASAMLGVSGVLKKERKELGWMASSNRHPPLQAMSHPSLPTTFKVIPDIPSMPQFPSLPVPAMTERMLVNIPGKRRPYGISSPSPAPMTAAPPPVAKAVVSRTPRPPATSTREGTTLKASEAVETEHDNSLSCSSSSSSDDSDDDNDKVESEPCLPRLPSRRRPARNQRELYQNMEGAASAQDRREMAPRHAKQGISRVRWQVQQQLASMKGEDG